MAQTKKSSLLEAASNVLIGFVTTLLVSPAIYALCGVTMKATQMGSVTALFTVVSLVRSYIIRRWFNKTADKTREEIEIEQGTDI